MQSARIAIMGLSILGVLASTKHALGEEVDSEESQDSDEPTTEVDAGSDTIAVPSQPGDEQLELEPLDWAEPSDGASSSLDPELQQLQPESHGSLPGQYCLTLCDVASKGGSPGQYTQTVTCGSGMAHGGCDLQDSVNDSAYIVASYPASDTQWRCEAYSENSETFNLAYCCTICTDL